MTALKECQTVSNQVVRLLRREREKRGLSKYALAERSGISQQAIGYMERGLKRPSLETVLRVADALEVDLADVIKQARKASVVHSRK